MSTNYPCGVCSKIVAKNHNAVCCDKCDMWVHMVCNKYGYRKLQKDNSPWFCVSEKEMPLSNLSNNQFKTFVSGKTIISPSLVEETQNDQQIQKIRNNLYTPQQISDLEI